MTRFGMTAVRAALAFLPPAIRWSCTNGRRKGSTIARREKRLRSGAAVRAFLAAEPSSADGRRAGEDCPARETGAAER
jgi:hypothetical protein